MRTRTKIIGLALIAGLIGGLNNFGPKRNGCDTYQGRNVIDQTSNTYVFDPSALEQRGSRDPAYAIEGSEDIVGKLDIGKRYCFDYTEPVIGSPRNLRNVRPD